MDRQPACGGRVGRSYSLSRTYISSCEIGSYLEDNDSVRSLNVDLAYRPHHLSGQMLAASLRPSTLQIDTYQSIAVRPVSETVRFDWLAHLLPIC